MRARWINAMMNHRGENKQDMAIITVSSAHIQRASIFPPASRGYFDYKQSEWRECERAHSPVCELAGAACARRGRQRSFVSLFISIYTHFIPRWTFCPRFCTHNLCRHILSFVRAGESGMGRGRKRALDCPARFACHKCVHCRPLDLKIFGLFATSKGIFLYGNFHSQGQTLTS
jgi:hypothetical protein